MNPCKPLRPLAMLLSLMTLTACASTPPKPTTLTTVLVKPDCVNWKVITYKAPPDDDDTVRQIRANNVAQRKACS